MTDKRELRRLVERVLQEKTSLGVDDINVIAAALMVQLTETRWFRDRAREALLDVARSEGLMTLAGDRFTRR